MLNIIGVVLGVLGGLFIWFLIILIYLLCKNAAMIDRRIFQKDSPDDSTSKKNQYVSDKLIA